MQLEALFKQPQALPAVPKIVHELIDSFNSDDISIDEIARKLGLDPLDVRQANLYRASEDAATLTTPRAWLSNCAAPPP